MLFGVQVACGRVGEGWGPCSMSCLLSCGMRIRLLMGVCPRGGRTSAWSTACPRYLFSSMGFEVVCRDFDQFRDPALIAQCDAADIVVVGPGPGDPTHPTVCLRCTQWGGEHKHIFCGFLCVFRFRKNLRVLQFFCSFSLATSQFLLVNFLIWKKSAFWPALSL